MKRDPRIHPHNLHPHPHSRSNVDVFKTKVNIEIILNIAENIVHLSRGINTFKQPPECGCFYGGDGIEFGKQVQSGKTLPVNKNCLYCLDFHKVIYWALHSNFNTHHKRFLAFKILASKQLF
jgi:hypothetical protein